jgi:hypothetical protein
MTQPKPRSLRRGDIPLAAIRLARRRWLAVTVAAVAASCLQPGRSRTIAAGEAAMAERTTRVKSVLEVQGQVLLKGSRNQSSDGRKPAPIEAKSTLEYEESFRLSSDRAGAGCSLQKFSVAELEDQIDKHTTKVSLREECRAIVKRVGQDGWVTACLDHPMTATERDLVEGPVATMFLDQLLPASRVEIGDRWELPPEITAKIFNLESIERGSLVVTLVDSDSQLGQLDVQASIQAEVRGVKTQLQVTGKAQIDRQQNLLSWLAVLLEEEREVGEAEPGFKIQARLRIRREAIPGLSSGEQLQSFLTQIEELDPKAQWLQFDSKAGAYRFVADRRWRTILDNGIDSTLKLVENNRTLAYCTITNLADMEPGRQLSMEGYQSDIQKTLGKRFGQFLEADERLSQTGLRMMRIVTLGSVEGVPVQWIHILLSNDGGRHLSLAYTMNQSSAEEFGTQEMQMAGSLEFTLRQLPTAPAEEKGKATAAAETASAAEASRK